MRNLTWIVAGLITVTGFAQEPMIGRTQSTKAPKTTSKTRKAGPASIVAGRSFGRVKLDMTKAELVKLLGKPNTEALLEGDPS